MNNNIPKCDPKYNYKPLTSRENIEWTKANPQYVINYTRERYKMIRQDWKCSDPHIWDSCCRRCVESHELEKMIAFIELFEESKP